MNYTEKIDYSSLSSYVDCPRKFFFQYVLHLRSDKPNLDLVFGSCWHYGLECAYNMLMISPDTPTSDLIEASRSGFTALWDIEGESFNEDLSFPKNAGNAFNMYHAYWTNFYQRDKDKRVIGVETPFVINLGHGLPNYIGRLDLTELQNEEAIVITDHKTAKFANETTFAGYDCSLQSDGYLAAGYLYYDKLPTLVYNVAQVAKTKSNFFHHMVMKSKSLIDRTLYDIKHYVVQILSDLKLYGLELELDYPECNDRNYVQHSFHRSPGYACTMYFRRCEYFDLCHLRNNAISYGNKTPQGYTIFEWDPEEHEANMKAKLKENKK